MAAEQGLQLIPDSAQSVACPALTHFSSKIAGPSPGSSINNSGLLSRSSAASAATATAAGDASRPEFSAS